MEKHLLAMPVGNLFKLVYRDHIPMKHGDRKRLGDELTQGQACQPKPKRLAIGNGDQNKAPSQVLLSNLMVRYLMEAACPLWGVMGACTTTNTNHQ